MGGSMGWESVREGEGGEYLRKQGHELIRIEKCLCLSITFFLKTFPIFTFLLILLPPFLPSSLSCLPSFLFAFLACLLPSFLPSFYLSLLTSFYLSFLPCFLPSFFASFFPCFLLAFLPCFLLSFLTYLLPCFLTYLLPSFLPSFLPALSSSAVFSSILPSFLACLIPSFLESPPINSPLSYHISHSSIFFHPPLLFFHF